MELKGTLAEKNRIYGQIAVSKIDKVLPSIRELTVTQNGVYVVPSDYDGFNPVLVKVPQKTEQEKTVDITENGSLKVMPDEENVLSQVNVNVNVPLRYDEGYSEGYTTGFYEGKNEGFDLGFQRGEASVELQEKTVTENGEVVPDDGYRGFSKVEVNVPLRYEEGYNKGYNKGFDEGKNEGIDIGFQRGEASVTLQEKTATENGEVIPDEGYKGFSKVNVNVPLRYEEGFDDGYDSGHTDGYLQGYKKGEESVVLQEKTVTENGEYYPDENYKAFSKVVVEVPIPEGYIKPSGTKEITENGTHDVKEYISVNVNVPSSGGGDDSEIEKFINLISNNIENFESDRITSVSQYAFAYRTNLKTVSLPNLKSSNTRAFANCDSLVSISIPNMSGYTYQYMCAYCSALKTADVRQASYVSGYSFYSCSALTRLEFNRVDTISANSFSGCSKLATLILRSTSVVSLNNTNAFTGTKIAGTGGYIYVPSSLIEDYKAASNWSTYASKFRAIEDYPDITGGA